jgi:hypothetical protein
MRNGTFYEIQFRDATPSNKTRIAVFETGSGQEAVEAIWQCSQLQKVMVWIAQQQPHCELDDFFL